jgi:hypothetical protein
MIVETVFEFRFRAEVRERGLELLRAIGADMVPLAGYLEHRIVRDLADPGHLLEVTRWASKEEAEAVLANYPSDPKAPNRGVARPPPGRLSGRSPRPLT